MHAPRRARTIQILLLLIVSTTLTYLPVCGARFLHWDDREQIPLNPDFQNLRLERMIEYARGPYMGSLYPASYWLFAGLSVLARTDTPDDRGDRFDARVFHIASLVLHVLCTLLIFGLLRSLVPSDTPATVGALLFALHPLQVGAVAWISGMNTVLAACFGVAALWAYTAGARSDRRRSNFYSLATLLYLLALLTKPSSVVLPAMAMLIDRFLLHRPWRSVLTWGVPWLLLAIPFIVITRNLQTAELVTPTPFWARPVVALDAISFYLYKLVWPATLLVDYGRPPNRFLQMSQAYWTWAVPIAIFFLCFLIRKRAPAALLCFGLFVVGVAPVLGLTPFDGQTMSTVSDRFVYLPMLAAALLVARATRHLRAPELKILAVVVLIALAVRAHVRTYQWKDDASLFTYELQKNPDSYAAHSVLAASASEQRNWPAATFHWTQAARVKPDDPKLHYNLGNALLNSGQFSPAIDAYRHALGLNPKLMLARYNLALALDASSNTQKAIEELNRVIEIDPTFGPAKHALEKLRPEAQ